jgi:hypothetical protein
MSEASSGSYCNAIRGIIMLRATTWESRSLTKTLQTPWKDFGTLAMVRMMFRGSPDAVNHNQ